ncbi:MAG: amino acid ABC transporter permease [Spirochaetia bacterium]|nr:amino acid ABC transporter permease [Spirochaetia bacterium]
MNKWTSILQGAAVTLILCGVSIALALVLGIIIALLRDSKIKLLSYLCRFYVWIFRGTPLMVQLFLIYFGLPSLGMKLSAVSAGILGLTLNCGAYISEIVRSGINAVDPGQREAAKALGMSPFQEMARIVFPQAGKISLLPLINQVIATIKNSSLLSAITITELTRAGMLISYSTFRYFEAYLAIALCYLILTSIFSSLGKHLEEKMK